MGKNAFAHLQDETGRIQIMFNRDSTQVADFEPIKRNRLAPYKFFEKKIDLGDIIGVEGHLFHTQKGELTIFAKKCTLLCKTLLPLADKHAGLADKELRYRKRWLDLITNPESQETFPQRSRISSFVRNYFQAQHFWKWKHRSCKASMAEQKRGLFIPIFNALEQDMFLRISLEIPLKTHRRRHAPHL